MDGRAMDGFGFPYFDELDLSRRPSAANDDSFVTFILVSTLGKTPHMMIVADYEED
jgi:hypothetical protein